MEELDPIRKTCPQAADGELLATVIYLFILGLFIDFFQYPKLHSIK